MLNVAFVLYALLVGFVYCCVLFGCLFWGFVNIIVFWLSGVVRRFS